jgi:chlorobactene glucosyltransferase
VDWLVTLAPWIVALPWLIGPLVVLVRTADTRHLKAYEPAPGPAQPRMSIIVPARDEAVNIERCVRSILATAYENAELIVVDDHSTDGTGDIARRIIGVDARARVAAAPPLPSGWFGKQWTCAHGASLATGDLLLFTDADTWHAPDLLPRAVTALQHRGADLLSVVGRQETATFWERVVQPVMFVGLLAVYGGTEAMSRARTPQRKIANGQFLLVRRDSYDALGGHRAVRAFVAEDMMLAQAWTAAGRAVHLVVGLDQFSTRMYRSLDEIVRGWGKNIWAAGKHLIGPHPFRLALTRVCLPLFPLIGVAPVIALLLGAIGVLSPWWMAAGAWAYAFQSVIWYALYAVSRFEPLYALLYPLGCVVASYLYAGASIRGDRTEWKGRKYRAA